MNRKVQLFCAWSGPLMTGIGLLGFVIAGVLPIPPAAHQSATAIAAFYGDSPARVAAGLVISSVGSGLIFPLIALIAVHMRRMEGRTPLLTFAQLAAGTVTGVFLLMPVLMMAVGAFRPDRSPELTLFLNDLAWLLFITPIAPFIVQNLAIGLAVLQDRNDELVLPRWVGYFNLWVAFLFLPDILAFFFYSGPFSWQGIFVFWLAAAAYSLWGIVMGLVLRRAVLRSGAEPLVPV